MGNVRTKYDVVKSIGSQSMERVFNLFVQVRQRSLNIFLSSYRSHCNYLSSQLSTYPKINLVILCMALYYHHIKTITTNLYTMRNLPLVNEITCI